MTGGEIGKQDTGFSVVSVGFANPSRGSQVIGKKLFEAGVGMTSNHNCVRQQLHSGFPIGQVAGGGNRECAQQA